MARTATVTKGDVTRGPDNLYTITFNLVYADDATELFSKSYSIHYQTGDDISKLGGFVKASMQTDINNYKASQTILNSTALTNAVSAIQAALEV